jgi:hypothetical protein
MTQQEFMLSILHEASRTESAPLLPFGEPPRSNWGRTPLPSSSSTCSLAIGVSGLRCE